MPGPKRPTPPESQLEEAVRKYRKEEAAQEAAWQAVTRHRQAKQLIVRELYLSGWSYQQIADALGISRQRAYSLAAQED